MLLQLASCLGCMEARKVALLQLLQIIQIHSAHGVLSSYLGLPLTAGLYHQMAVTVEAKYLVQSQRSSLHPQIHMLAPHIQSQNNQLLQLLIFYVPFLQSDDFLHVGHIDQRISKFPCVVVSITTCLIQNHKHLSYK